MNNNKSLQMGWVIPSIGDTTAISDPSKSISQSREHFERVAVAAEQAGFDYVLVPASPFCWDAWVTASFVIARTQQIKTLVAVKPGFTHPVIQAKMFATFDHLSKGRIYINLTCGLSEQNAFAEEPVSTKASRYEQLQEDLELMKRLWMEEDVEYQGKDAKTHAPKAVPSPFQQPHPPFFLGGASEPASEVSAKHSSVHLFQGDYPTRIAEQIKAMRARAAKYGRSEAIEFAIRLQIFCRETEAQAWAANHQHNERCKSAQYTCGEGRPDTTMAIVGTPQQIANQLLAFIEVGCSGFCLSGYPQDEEVERFGRLVMPLLKRKAGLTPVAR